MGASKFNLAQYAKQSQVTEKLYTSDAKDMYIEISVKSNPVDGAAGAPGAAPVKPAIANKPFQNNFFSAGRTPNAVITSSDAMATAANPQTVPPRKSKNEPVTEEDHILVEEFKQRE